MRLPKDSKGRPPKGYRADGTRTKAFGSEWRLDPAKYNAALAAAQERANRDGCDVGLYPCDLSQTWSNRALPAAQYRTGDDTTMVCGHRCQIVTPTRPTQTGTFGLACAQHPLGVSK